MKTFFCFFLLNLILLSGCSTSNNGAVLPDEAIDDKSPEITNTSPPDFRSTFLPTNTSFQLYFDELVDVNSIEGNVTLHSGKTRDIYTTAPLGTREFVFLEQDERGINVTHKEELYTFEREELINVTVSEDGEENRETRFITEEAQRSVLSVVPTSRLGLWSQYSLVVDRGLKDRSPIAGFSPVDGLESTGNFITPILYDFGTEDGAWQPGMVVNDAYLIDGYSIGATDYISSDRSGAIFWIQQKSDPNAFSHLFWRPFDQEKQSLSGLAQRFDYIPAVDGMLDQYREVRSFGADAIGDQHCVTWVYSESTSLQSVYLRCATASEHYPRMQLATHPGDKPLSSIAMHRIDDQYGFVSYLFDGVLHVYALSYQPNMSPSVLAYKAFGNASLNILEVARSIRSSSSDIELSIVFAAEDVVASANERFMVGNLRFVIEQDLSLQHQVVAIERGDSSYQGLSIGFDYLGMGVAGWTKGSGNNRGFFTATFGGVAWSSPLAVQKDGRGPITDGTVFVFEDGQALFAWVQEVLGTYQVKVQGLFSGASDVGDVGIVRPSALEISKGNFDIEDLQILGDREGNALLMYTANASISFSRFRQNVEWNSAWSSIRGLGDYYGGGITLSTILEDGRLALTNKETFSGHDALLLSLFSDF